MKAGMMRMNYNVLRAMKIATTQSFRLLRHSHRGESGHLQNPRHGHAPWEDNTYMKEESLASTGSTRGKKVPRQE